MRATNTSRNVTAMPFCGSATCESGWCGAAGTWLAANTLAAGQERNHPLHGHPALTSAPVVVVKALGRVCVPHLWSFYPTWCACRPLHTPCTSLGACRPVRTPCTSLGAAQGPPMVLGCLVVKTACAAKRHLPAPHARTHPPHVQGCQLPCMQLLGRWTAPSRTQSLP